MESSEEKIITMEISYLPRKLAQLTVHGSCMLDQLVTTV